MVRYKPSSLTALALKTDDPLSIGIGVFGDILTAAVGVESYLCGNCKKSITFKRGEQRPVVCRNCGGEIDWVGIFTKIKRVCPECGKVYVYEDKFCPYHSPAVALVQQEVEK